MIYLVLIFVGIFVFDIEKRLVVVEKIYLCFSLIFYYLIYVIDVFIIFDYEKWMDIMSDCFIVGRSIVCVLN